MSRTATHNRILPRYSDAANELFELRKKRANNHNNQAPVQCEFNVISLTDGSSVLTVEEQHLVTESLSKFGQPETHQEMLHGNIQEDLEADSYNFEWLRIFDTNDYLSISRRHVGKDGGLAWVMDLVDLEYQDEVHVYDRDEFAASVANRVSEYAISQGLFNGHRPESTNYQSADANRIRNLRAFNIIEENFQLDEYQVRVLRQPLHSSAGQPEAVIQESLPFENHNSAGSES